MIVSRYSPPVASGTRASGRSREQGGSGEGFDQRVEEFARLAVPVARHAGEPVDEDPSRAHGRRLGQEHAVRFHDLVLEHTPRGGQDLQTTLRLQGAEVPAKLRGVPDELLRRDLERHDDARLVEVVRAVIHTFDAEGGLSRPRGPGHDHHIAARESSKQNVVESGYSRAENIGIRHGLLVSWRLTPFIYRSVDRGGSSSRGPDQLALPSRDGRWPRCTEASQTLSRGGSSAAVTRPQNSDASPAGREIPDGRVIWRRESVIGRPGA